MIQLSANTAHINNRFGDHNVGVAMGMLGVKYSGYYGDNLFRTGSTHAMPVDNDMDVAFSVTHTALNYSAEHQNGRMNNRSTCN